MTIWRRIFGGGKPKQQEDTSYLDRMLKDLTYIYGDLYKNNSLIYEAAYTESPTYRNRLQQEIDNKLNYDFNAPVTNIATPIVTPPTELDTTVSQQPVLQPASTASIATPTVTSTVLRRSFGTGKRNTSASTATSTPAVRKRQTASSKTAKNNGTITPVAKDDVPTPPVSYFPNNSTATGKPREYPFPSSGVDAIDEALQRQYDINYNSSKPKTTYLTPLPVVTQSMDYLPVQRNPKVISEAIVRYLKKNPGKVITSYGFMYYAVPGSGAIMAKAIKPKAGYSANWYNVFKK